MTLLEMTTLVRARTVPTASYRSGQDSSATSTVLPGTTRSADCVTGRGRDSRLQGARDNAAAVSKTIFISVQYLRFRGQSTRGEVDENRRHALVIVRCQVARLRVQQRGLVPQQFGDVG